MLSSRSGLILRGPRLFRGVATKAPDGRPWDVVVIGGGHNGLTSAAYLAKAGKRVLVLERRHCVGGAAVTEEIVPGFKFSRASYVYSLFRPQIVRDLDLHRHGLHVYKRSPSSFTPMLDGRHLLLGAGDAEDRAQIGKFSRADADAFPRYNAMLDRMVSVFEPLIDSPPPDLPALMDASTPLRDRAALLLEALSLGRDVAALKEDVPAFLELMTAPARKVLERWFESEPLRTTLATDAVIGAMTSPSQPQSGYVLFHHVMGELDGEKGAWGYVRGGMGALSEAIASSAREAGAVVATDVPVASVTTDAAGAANGVTLRDGTHVPAEAVFCNASPSALFGDLLPREAVPEPLRRHMASFSTTAASTKINVALSRLPQFACMRDTEDGTPKPHHRGTIHFEAHLDEIDAAYHDALAGKPSERPLIEMVLPSSLDDSIAPDGAHVCLLFVQYTPYQLANGSWEQEDVRKAFADRVFSTIEAYAPGFKDSIVDYDMLAPPDLERVFGLPQGNIFHGAMGLDQLLWMRPAPGASRYATPVKGLYLCGAGAHPGGGVMGAPGRNAALAFLGARR